VQQNSCIAITGGTGLVGGKLVSTLPRPLVLTRSPEKYNKQPGSEVRYLKWDSNQILESQDLEGVTGVIHLAGDPIAQGRWNTIKKQKIRDSRVIGTRCLVKSLAAMKQKPSVLVSASAVGFYGDRPGDVLDENSQPGVGFLPEVCQEWEAEALAARELGIRVCLVRIGIVMDTSGGALQQMLPFFKLGLGGPLGLGRQYFPWVHVDDLVGIIHHCLSNQTVSGPINAVAPQATTNWQFTKSLGKVLHRPTLLPIPKFGLKLLYGEFADNLFDWQQVVPKVAQDSGYQFQFPGIDDTLQDLLG